MNITLPDNTLGWILAIIAIGGVFFEISPIKFNPISWIVSLLFKPVNSNIDNLRGEVNEKFKNVEESIQEIKEEQHNIRLDQDKSRFLVIRWEILTFRNNINNGNMFTETEYQHIFDNYKEYEELYEKHHFSNGYLEDAISDIRKHYDEHKGLNVKYF